MEFLYDKLKNYAGTDVYPFHMPGHKRNRALFSNQLPYHLDITEIDGFDNLHIPEGILKDAQLRATKIFHAEETHFLINGSTVGILSGILGSVSRGGKLLILPDCHKAVYHAVRLGELQGMVLEEQQKGSFLSVETVKSLQGRMEIILKNNPDIEAVLVTSPTYEGVVSPIEELAKAAHDRDCILIVDEAHGAHLGFHPYFPENSNERGADVVIQSLHKNLPALTQTAVLHMNGNRVNREKVREYLHMLQTSSPSYVLMASMDECVRLLEDKKESLFADYVARLEELRAKLRTLSSLHLYDPDYRYYDRGKLVIQGPQELMSDVYETLRVEDGLQMEMTGLDYLIAMTSIADTKEGFDRLAKALLRIDEEMRTGTFVKRQLPDARRKRHSKEVCYTSLLKE